ncbi:HAD family phosphatase [Gemmobacter fulvus]|uniref:HAD family phosphatase n=1 Tax=Gemmobacter fulvus TaxID=2840474 RepID=A0A975PA66_9RHOB|nr:HAD family phosphatase [Gemmobacter fulvus]MBT9244795.1 HAD family phosphatase [Gemmobacter fulvus]MDQ1848674.1 HAD family phosphatase [Gemmobacter fulvus]QWK91636.1 HAD family phosphatase [Gemmobacter fulvus]
MTIEAVIFDIGNVLIEWNPERFYDWAIGRAQREALFAEVDLHSMNDAIDAGGLFRETIYDWADRHPDWSAEIRMWHDNWIDMASPRIEGSIALLRALRLRGVPVFALTNFGIHSFAYAQTQYDFLSEFDRAYVSGQMGVIKPDPRIYELVEADCGLAPARLLFTDDRADNIAAAQARGWQTHPFQGWQGWAQRLVAEDLLTEKEAGL